MTLIHGYASVTIVVVETVFSFAAVVAIGLRIWARRLIKKQLSLNDWAAFTALVTMTPTRLTCSCSQPPVFQHGPGWYRLLR